MTTLDSETMRASLGRVENVLVGLASLALALIVLVISLSALGRYLFHAPIPGSDTIVAVFLAPAVTFLSLAAGLRDKHHVALVTLTRRLRPTARRTLHAVISVAAAVLLGLVAWKTCLHTYDAVRTGRNDGATGLPLAVAFATVPIGCALAAVRLLVAAVEGPEPGVREAD